MRSNLSVINVYKTKSKKSKISTQLLYGDSFNIIKKKGKWIKIKNDYDAVLLSIGSEEARDLNIPGRDAEGILPAMDFLPIQNKVVSGEINKGDLNINAKNG